MSTNGLTYDTGALVAAEIPLQREFPAGQFALEGFPIGHTALQSIAIVPLPGF